MEQGQRKKPKMIMFDFGGTLVRAVHEFRGVEGIKEVLKHVKDTHGVTASENMAFYDELNKEV